MALNLFARPARPSIISSDSIAFVCKICRRNAASYRRTRKMLRVKTGSDFAPSQIETQDHIIFNPPSSEPNVYHTPPKFLPKSDPRRALLTVTSTTTSSPQAPTSALASIAAARLAQHTGQSLPALRSEPLKKHHLSREQAEEIRRLREEDPQTWSIRRLAQKFECSEFFVALCSKPSGMKFEHEARLEEVKSRWGKRRTEAREDRQERKKLWGMDA